MIRMSDKSNKDKLQIRELWKTCFGDTEAFMDFYFERIFPKNQIIVAEENGKVIGMIHLNPYTFTVESKEEKTYFIVGVAVHEDYRLQGKMKEMMEYAFSIMRLERIRFTYLWPANMDYYKSFGFRKNTELVQLLIPTEKIEDFGILCKNIDESLQFSYEEYYIPSYSSEDILCIKQEISSEGGEFSVIYDEDDIQGYFAITPCKDTLEVNHIVPCKNLKLYLLRLFQSVSEIITDEDREIHVVRISMDRRIYDLIPGGNVYRTKTGEEAIENEIDHKQYLKKDHIYMVKVLDTEFTMNPEQFLFTEIV